MHVVTLGNDNFTGSRHSTGDRLDGATSGAGRGTPAIAATLARRRGLPEYKGRAAVALTAARAAGHLEAITNMTVQAPRVSRAKLRSGWILSGIVIAFLIADFGATLFGIAPIKKATLEIGYPLGLLWLVGGLEFICLLLYAIPASSVLGAIILTGFLGGAIVSHLRVASALTPEMIVSFILGVLAWGGLWFRDPRLRALIPWRRGSVAGSAIVNVAGAS
jgi:hypothetical protein